jgi:hypothetical protein
MAGMTRKRSTVPKRKSTAAKAGGYTKGGAGAKSKEAGRLRTTGKHKKTTKPRMTREADEAFRAVASRRRGDSLTKKSATFVLDAPSGQAVSIAGSFNNWEPQAMTQGRDGLWRITLQLASGTHQYKFLVDTEWREDPNNPRKIPNEHGGFNSICDVL